MARILALILALPTMLCAEGLLAEWEVRDLALDIAKQMDLLAPAIANVDPASWPGASAAYREQRDLAGREAGYAAAAARQVAAKPMGLGTAFELHLRVQSVEGLLESLATGARNYGASGAMDKALDIAAAARAPHSRLRDYLMDLAASKDLELASIDAEAQRCRAEMVKTPAVVPATKKTKAITNSIPNK